jgi:hypothetical protein
LNYYFRAFSYSGWLAGWTGVNMKPRLLSCFFAGFFVHCLAWAEVPAVPVFDNLVIFSSSGSPESAILLMDRICQGVLLSKHQVATAPGCAAKIATLAIQGQTIVLLGSNQRTFGEVFTNSDRDTHDGILPVVLSSPEPRSRTYPACARISPIPRTEISKLHGNYLQWSEQAESKLIPIREPVAIAGAETAEEGIAVFRPLPTGVADLPPGSPIIMQAALLCLADGQGRCLTVVCQKARLSKRFSGEGGISKRQTEPETALDCDEALVNALPALCTNPTEVMCEAMENGATNTTTFSVTDCNFSPLSGRRCDIDGRGNPMTDTELQFKCDGCTPVTLTSSEILGDSFGSACPDLQPNIDCGLIGLNTVCDNPGIASCSIALPMIAITDCIIDENFIPEADELTGKKCDLNIHIIGSVNNTVEFMCDGCKVVNFTGQAESELNEQLIEACFTEFASISTTTMSKASSLKTTSVFLLSALATAFLHLWVQ